MKPPPLPSPGKASLPAVGNAVNRRVGALLAEGSLSCVYELLEYQCAPITRPLVLKQIKSAFVHDPQIREQLTLLRERRSELIHPNLCERIEVHIGEQDLWIIEQRVEGQSLATILEERGRMSLSEAQQVWQQIAKALHFLHQQGLRHTDLKPGHVLLAKVGEAYQVTVIDAGLARPLADGLIGTPSYLSPELVRSATPRPTARSDIFAFGCVVYEMLFRQRAFPAQTVAERRGNLSADPGHHFLTGEDQPKTEAVRSALFSALEESPERRPAKICELIARLDAVFAPPESNAGSAAPTPSPLPASSGGHRVLPAVRDGISPPPSESGQLRPPNPNIHRTPGPRPTIRSRVPYVMASLALIVGLSLGVKAWLPDSESHSGVITDFAAASDLVDLGASPSVLDLPAPLIERIADSGLDGSAVGNLESRRPHGHKEEPRPEPHPNRPKLHCALRGTSGIEKKDLEAIRRGCEKLPASPSSRYCVVLKQLLKELVPQEFPNAFLESHKSFFECVRTVELFGSIPKKGVSYVCE